MRKIRFWCATITSTFFAILFFSLPVLSAEQTVQFNIPEQAAATGIPEFARQAGIQILAPESLVRGKRTAPLIGSHTVSGALTILLNGTGLVASTKDGSTYVITAAGTAFGASERVSNDQSRRSSEGELPNYAKAEDTSRNEGLDEIVVTGTLIHNIEPITPAITITGQQMIEQGYSRLDQVFDQLPQNFNSVSQASNGFIGIGSNSGANQFFASGVDLRGLGAGATLVLLNGRRLAMTANGGAVDISSIPVSAIDRVEILTDGASAIYGSDAVAGVVNIITKRDFEGVETGVRSTEITKGKAPDYGGHVLGGYNWGSGNVMVNFDGEKDNALPSTNRSFEPPSSAPFDLLPEQIRRSVFVSARQELASQLSLTSDVLVSDRTFGLAANCCAGGGGPYGVVSGSAQQLALSLELDYSFAPDWNLKVSGQFSRERDFNQQASPVSDPTANGDAEFLTYKTSTLDAVVDGKLFELPGGAIRAAAGGQAKRESLFDETLSVDSNGAYSPPGSDYAVRTSEAAFGELFIPIVGAPNAIPLIRKLNLDVAGRFDHYSDFGSTTNPKVSLQWVPIEGLTAHASYSKSFRAPELFELAPVLGRVGSSIL